MTRIDLLRSHEAYAYQVAYYLLRKEEPAAAAAQEALLAVAADRGFFSLPPSMRESWIKRQVMKEALAVRLKRA
ncbi:hypothetical protein COLU111180_00695 [Cohnella lubricantis]|uniref:Uncharacterized protein n=1 Tax=Cohnella lubricantis TaxID=2163172 RepID=A0A841TFF1_9BACL|nr:hypothetical protein [Cohnella lubricantis]MBB6679742.1 hypothetical protein [Cohnella lubricantis]MBP2119466.1 DNA-directed RNA polymerase specialized sigma24 family protein [Cohnella lubricantis]